MNKEHWLTAVLDGSVSKEEVLALLDESYELTK
jgi:predicted DNA-binding protein (MmcQ/YjbR family)